MENILMETSSTMLGFKHSFIRALNKTHVVQFPKPGDTSRALKSFPLLPGVQNEPHLVFIQGQKQRNQDCFAEIPSLPPHLSEDKVGNCENSLLTTQKSATSSRDFFQLAEERQTKEDL